MTENSRDQAWTVAIAAAHPSMHLNSIHMACFTHLMGFCSAQGC